MTGKPARVRLGAEAEKDFVLILEHTRERFGSRQEAIYETTILSAIAELDAGPEVIGSLARDDLRPGIRSMHVARHGRRGRHVLMYRAGPENDIDVIRILHDSMDFARHIPPSSTDRLTPAR